MNLDFNKNEDANKLKWSELRQRRNKVTWGGGKQRIEKLRTQGKLPARERLKHLFDNGQWIELGTFAGWEMYQEYGGAPAGGVIVGLGKVSGRLAIVVANDPTVKAGAWFPITAKKNLRAQEIAMENRIPIIYLVDSAGVFLPMQDEVFPDKDHFGRIFRNNAIMSAEGILQIAAVMGSCVAGGAYLPVMSDESLIVDKTGSIFLAGPYLVKAAIGEEVDKESLGGATTQTAISGVIDHKMPDDATCLETIRKFMAHVGDVANAGFNRIKPQPPKYDPEEIAGIMPADPSRPYDMMEVILRLVDGSEFTHYKPDYGKTIICGYARIDGWAVGIVANQRLIIKNSKGELQVGGVIYSDSADKAARFIMVCNQKKIPLVFLQDVTGFMVGTQSEHGGIIKDGAKMVNAVANSVVPKFTIIVGNSYGAGNYAMCGKAYDPRLIAAWPSARIAVMGGGQAAQTLLQIRIATLQKQGKTLSEEDKQALLKEISDRYERQTSPYYAAARLWVDEIILPTETRHWISTGIEMANHAPIKKQFNVGVIQT